MITLFKPFYDTFVTKVIIITAIVLIEVSQEAVPEKSITWKIVYL